MFKLLRVILLLIISLMLLFPSVLGGSTAEGISGKNIKVLDSSTQSILKKIKEAEKDFIKNFNGSYFLTGYLFKSVSKSFTHGTYISSGEKALSRIKRDGDNIRVYHYGPDFSGKEEDNKNPASRMVVFLHKKVGNSFEITDSTILNYGCTYNTDKLPVYWFGDAETSESFGFVKDLFKNGKGKLKKHLLPVIAIHNHKNSIEFLYNVAKGDFPSDLRKNSVFWLGAVKDNRSVSYLKKLAENEDEFEIRKGIIFALYIHGSDEAVKELIKNAKKNSSTSIRKNATFWLGQKASKESIRALKEIIISDDELKVKTAAVFAISQLNKNKSIPILIDIVKNNRSPRVRKKAIFWLGQKDDKRVIDLFEKILLK